MDINKKIIISILFLIIIITIPKNDIRNDNNCVTKIETKEVKGNSLSPLIEPGQQVKILYDYYECHEIKKGDIVAYGYKGNPNPIIKIIKAIPGDKLAIRKNTDTFQITINNKSLKNSEGELYQIDESESKILELYEKSYSTIPENTYLILGNQITGTIDSTKFGLIHKNDVLGKII